MYLVKIYIAIFCSCLLIFSQEIHAQTKSSEEIGLAAYNIGFGVISTTIGALINKPKNESVWKCIKKASWQGALGGALQFGGKALSYQITRTNNYYWGWSEKIVHSAGASICENAAMGNPYKFGQYWVLDYAAFRLTMGIKNGEFKAHPQFNLLFLYDLQLGLSHGSVDWKTSFQLGTFTFASNSSSLGNSAGVNDILGETSSRSIVYAKDNDQNLISSIIAHESVHICQANEYRVMNTYFDPLKSKITNNTVNKIFDHVYIELPYCYMFYVTQFNKQYYYENLYEFEAQFFATNAYVDRRMPLY